jgi:hypothetical protein
MSQVGNIDLCLPANVDGITRYIKGSQYWRKRTNVVVCIGTLYALGVSLWAAMHGLGSLTAFIQRVTSLGPFLIAFLWCKVNYKHDEQMCSLLSALPILVEQAPTVEAKSEIASNMAKAIVEINSPKQWRVRRRNDSDEASMGFEKQEWDVRNVRRPNLR